MGIRYRKSIKICKGVRMNISKSGVSTPLAGAARPSTWGGTGHT